jgi:DNA primase
MDQVDQIREKTDIVALLSEYLELKQAGRNFKTTCPFHHEKSPSFVVSPEDKYGIVLVVIRGEMYLLFLWNMNKWNFQKLFVS